MSLRKRVRKIETSLPPVETVLLWLKGTLELGQEGFTRETLAHACNPRGWRAKLVGDAIRENVNDAIKAEVLDQVVREAQKEADLRIVLVMKLHEQVQQKLTDSGTELLEERFARLLSQTSLVGFQPKSWELWRAQLADSLVDKWCLKKIVASISIDYYRGHPLLFDADEERLNSQIACLEDLMKEYNSLERRLPGCKPIDGANLSSISEKHAERQAQNLIALAKVKTLVMFGEEQAAMELLDSTADNAIRAIKQLRSLSKPQEGMTC
jgi:hypothetical protein